MHGEHGKTRDGWICSEAESVNGNGNIENAGGGATPVPPPVSLALIRKARLRRMLNNPLMYKIDYLIGETAKDYAIAQYGGRIQLVWVIFWQWLQLFALSTSGFVYWWWKDLRGVTEFRMDHGHKCRHRVGCTKSYYDDDDNCMDDLFLTFIREPKHETND